jgi:hypothetical protein
VAVKWDGLLLIVLEGTQVAIFPTLNRFGVADLQNLSG